MQGVRRKLSEDFIKIAEAKQALKGSFIGTIIKAGDLKSGTKDGRDWTKKVFTIQDDSGDADLVSWGDEIQSFSVGNKYEFINPWWKTYEGKVSVSVGKYGTAKLIEFDQTTPTPTDLKQEQIIPPKTGNIPVGKCQHGLAEQKDYICKKCLVTYYEGLVNEMREKIGK